MEQPLENNDPEKDFDRLILNELQGMAQVRVAQLFWVTVLVFLGWSVSSYVHTQSYWLDFLWVKVGFIGICLCIYLLFIYQQVSYEWVAHTCLATLTIHNSLFLAFLNQALQAYYFWAYAIIYLVVGLIIIWKPVHSLAQFILALGSIGIIFSMYNPHSLEDFAVYGGLLFITMSLVTTILAKMRYDLARRELTVRVMINRSNKKLYQQQREITKQNRQILESESNLRAILENNDIAIWLINRSYELIEFNELFKSSSYDMFGVTLEKNKSILALQGFASLSDVWKQRYDRALQGEIVKEEDCYRKGPELLYIETTVYPIYAHNEIIGASVFSKDTTEQKAAASQLATSNIRFKAVIESTQDMIFALDENYCYITFNQSHFDFMQVMYRIDIENGDGIMKIPEPSKELQDFRQDIDDALGGQQFTKEYVFKRKRHRIYFETSYNPIRDHEDKVTGVAIFARDVTERKMVEKQIKTSEQLLASINKNIQEGIYRSTPESGLIYVNEAFARLFGYESAEALLKKSVIDLYYYPEQRQDFVEILLDQKSYTNREVLFKKQDGTSFWGLMSSIAKTTEEGEIVFDGAIRDITDTKEVRKQLEAQNTELKKINSELDSFVYSASHDLKAPLASVLGLINIARAEEDVSLIHTYLDMMAQSINKLDNFIKDIVAYSRNARLVLSNEEVNFEELIEQSFSNLQYLDNADKIERFVQVEATVPFYNDSKRLSVVLNNLIANAIIYSSPQRKSPYIKILVEIDEQQAKVAFHDNGQGISEEHLKKIFEMFYRASQNSKGSGLGLYIVKETIDKLAGDIYVQSQLGKGTSFFVTLPNGLKKASPSSVQIQAKS